MEGLKREKFDTIDYAGNWRHAYMNYKHIAINNGLYEYSSCFSQIYIEIAVARTTPVNLLKLKYSLNTNGTWKD